jgi:hypothetical protein
LLLLKARAYQCVREYISPSGEHALDAALSPARDYAKPVFCLRDSTEDCHGWVSVKQAK